LHSAQYAEYRYSALAALGSGNPCRNDGQNLRQQHRVHKEKITTVYLGQ